LKVIFLGTNGWYDSPTGNTISTLVVTKSCAIILDAGFGIVKADRYIDQNKPVYIFLSHLHLDHTVGLHALAKFRLKKKLKICVPDGLTKDLNGFFAQPLTMPISRFPFKAQIVPVKEAKVYSDNCFSGVSVQARELTHASLCFGYRFELENKVISYCTDTGVCDNALKLAQGADLLITECALKKGQPDEGWPHLDPLQAASLANKAQAKKLALTHFDAFNYKTLKERKVAQAHARKIFPQAYAVCDGTQITL